MAGQISELFWDATYAIVMALMEHFPELNPEDMGLYELANIVQSLPGFVDDPGVANERILLDIQTMWLEETFSL